MGLYALDALLRQTPSIMTAGANALGRKTTNYLNSFGVTSTPTPSTQDYSVRMAPMRLAGPSSKKKNRRRGKKATLYASPRDGNIRLRVPIFVPLLNTQDNACITKLALMGRNDDIIKTLYYHSNNFGGMTAVFQTVTYHRMVAKFVPTVSDSTSGSFAMGFNPLHSAVNTNASYQTIIERRGVMNDIKIPSTFVWSPDTSQEAESKLTSDSTGVAISAVGEGSLRSFFPGFLMIRSENSLVNAASVGSLLIEVDVTFSDIN